MKNYINNASRQTKLGLAIYGVAIAILAFGFVHKQHPTIGNNLVPYTKAWVLKHPDAPGANSIWFNIKNERPVVTNGGVVMVKNGGAE